MLFVFGGDGTMLRAARDIAGSKTPILGINTGTLGVLTAVPADGLSKSLETGVDRRISIEPRA